ncbi:hydroxymethylglutaryl-CoA synthase family protein [Pseudomonas poae]|uniref:hydroxymethylglutaryl-CoA synthase family protein n=1 Tax=Pseudomonas poae TaxID=200451 RepID=UPI0023DDEE67|nr:hydroxymethylglutaryl-CoA synthase [Pseudomonas poae]
MMRQVGIEAMNVFGGAASLDVTMLARHRKLDSQRFGNLLMHEKSVALHSEDPVTFAVNAAKPLIDALSPEERDQIELLITCTESGIDFGKSVSTYVHDYLGLKNNCRVFELKQACYSGTAGFHSAVQFVLSQTSPNAKALVVAVDLCRFLMIGDGGVAAQDWAFSEPSGGAGAVAMLISDKPRVFSLDIGASGYYSFEVMDTCRPEPDSEAGDADLSLMSYLDCCEQTFNEYRLRVDDVDYARTFDYLAFHTPFGGMVKGAHRLMMRKFAPGDPSVIEADFTQRVEPGLAFCQRVGNIMGATMFLSLAGIISTARFDQPRRIGCFSYGSGCCSEFFSGTVTPQSRDYLSAQAIAQQLDKRYRLSLPEYESILLGNDAVRFGTRDHTVACPVTDRVIAAGGLSGKLLLSAINGYHREYSFQP